SRRHTRSKRDWSSDVCSSDLGSLHTLDEVKMKLRENIQRIRRLNHHIKLVGVLETLAFRKHKPAWHLEGPNGFTYEEMVSAFVRSEERRVGKMSSCRGLQDAA